jgi:hypothetical protein
MAAPQARAPGHPGHPPRASLRRSARDPRLRGHRAAATFYSGEEFEPTIKRRAKATGDEEVVISAPHSLFGIPLGGLAIDDSHLYFSRRSIWPRTT